MPTVSPAQKRLMEAAAHTEGGYGGVPQSVGKEFVGKDGAIKAAGICFLTPDGKALFLKRSASGDHAGEWCFPGGGTEGNETPEQTAAREVNEEIGFTPEGLPEFAARMISTPDATQATSRVDYTTFLQAVPAMFIPTVNEEHIGFAWAPLAHPPAPLHPGVQAVLTKMAMDGGATKWSVKIVSRTGGAAKIISISAATEAEALSKAQKMYGAGSSFKVDKGYGVSRASDMALDRDTVRKYDLDGRLHVESTNISKANVCPYYGREIPDYGALGLTAEKIYKLYRDPDELRKAAGTFNNIPLLSCHVPVSADDHQPDLVIGSTGTDAEFDEPHLKNSLVVWSRDAIEAIESEIQKELSCAYRYRADMSPGKFEGEAYDGVMRDIVGNHVALVKTGRAGSDVVVGDRSLPKLREIIAMPQNQVLLSRKAALAKGALLVFLKPRLAQDATIDLTPILKGVTSKNFKEHKAALLAGITTLTKDKLAADATLEDVTELLDALEEVDELEGADAEPKVDPKDKVETKAEDEEDDDDKKRKEFLKSKLSAEDMATYDSMPRAGKANDETPEEKEAREKKEKEGATDMVTKPAMDAAIAQAVKDATDTANLNQRQIRDAERDVRVYVGELAMAHDSAESVYRTALGALGIKLDGIHPSAFPAILKMQPVPGTKKTVTVAMDAAGEKSFNERYPDAARIGTL